MTNEQAISIMKIQRPRTGTKEKLEAYDMAIEALEQKPCDDCISREEVLNTIYRHEEPNDENGNRYIEYSDALCFDIEQLSSVTPQPKVGKWMHPYKSDIACECSECHIQMPITKSFNYCPNCGCRMKGEDNV